MTKIKSKSLFDFLKCLTYQKTQWENLSELDQKNFNIYMINRFVSMDMDLIHLANYLQAYNMFKMNNREAYKLYYDLLPKNKIYFKYIKARKDSKNKINDNLISLFSEYFKWSSKETEENLKLLLKSKTGKESVKNQIKQFGLKPSEYGIK